MTNQKYKRDRRRIRSWMIRHGITGASVAKTLGVSDALVCSTLGGHRNNRRVLSHLITLGCPIRVLALPEDLLLLTTDNTTTSLEATS